MKKVFVNTGILLAVGFLAISVPAVRFPGLSVKAEAAKKVQKKGKKKAVLNYKNIRLAAGKQYLNKEGKKVYKKGASFRLKVKSGKAVKWTSSRKKIASVTKGGMVTARRPGKSVVTAGLRNGKKLRCKVEVYRQPGFYRESNDPAQWYFVEEGGRRYKLNDPKSSPHQELVKEKFEPVRIFLEEYIPKYEDYNVSEEGRRDPVLTAMNHFMRDMGYQLDESLASSYTRETNYYPLNLMYYGKGPAKAWSACVAYLCKLADKSCSVVEYNNRYWNIISDIDVYSDLYAPYRFTAMAVRYEVDPVWFAGPDKGIITVGRYSDIQSLCFGTPAGARIINQGIVQQWPDILNRCVEDFPKAAYLYPDGDFYCARKLLY